MKTLTGLGILVCAIVLGAAATASAAGASPTREQYVDTADSLCEPAVKGGDRLFTRANRLLDRDRAAAAVRLFIRGWRSFKPTTKELRGLPTPAGDAGKIDRWLDLEMASTNLQIKAWKVFIDDYDRSVRIAKRGNRVHKRAHRAVSEFDFRFCA